MIASLGPGFPFQQLKGLGGRTLNADESFELLLRLGLALTVQKREVCKVADVKGGAFEFAIVQSSCLPR